MDPLLKKLTIAIPLHNEGEYLESTIRSCIGQAGKILLCDNASDDGSSAICQKYAEEYPDVVQHIRHDTDIGAFENFQRPMFECQTPYFCWLGGHDKMGENYAVTLLRALENDAEAVLACGIIQHIDEQDKELPRKTLSAFLNKENETPLKRVEQLARSLRDCFIFYGVYRVDALRRAWYDKACLGTDRIVLFRLAGEGRFIFDESCTLFARDFPKKRDSRKDKERRSKVLVEASGRPLAKSNFERNRELINATLVHAKDDATLSHALRIVGVIRRRHHERRRQQKLRLITLGALVAALFVFAWVCAI